MALINQLYLVLFLKISLILAIPARIEDFAEDLVSHPTEDKVCLTDVDFLKPLKRGGFGEVWAARLGNCTYHAVKILEKYSTLSKTGIAPIKLEKEIPAFLDHPNIVKLMYTFQTETHLFLGMELLHGGDLSYQLKARGPLCEDVTKFYVSEIVLAIDYLHKNDIVYRDLKPANILLDTKGHVKIVDFGLCKRMVNGKKPYACCGTQDYTAPEVLARLIDGYDKTVDWWSLGVTIHEMLSLKKPRQTIRNIGFGVRQFEVKCAKVVSTKARKLIKGFMTHNPKKRLGCGGGEEIKKHEFFSGVNWEDVASCKLKPPSFSRLVDENKFKDKTPVEIYKGPPNSRKLTEAQQELFSDFSFVSPLLIEQGLKKDDNDVNNNYNNNDLDSVSLGERYCEFWNNAANLGEAEI